MHSQHPKKVCVERVRYLRNAEAHGHFDEALAMMAAHSQKFGHSTHIAVIRPIA
ncbi:hypothetical protein [Lichenicola sp.]|uniref:hypothetical protein n=1 Tax=Lichenicola sp. TaxID=2804529 RepID=UPI003B009E16